jgi:hypothetical protein
MVLTASKNSAQFSLNLAVPLMILLASVSKEVDERKSFLEEIVFGSHRTAVAVVLPLTKQRATNGNEGVLSLLSLISTALWVATD